jgi:hypothetical protein
MGRKPSHHLAAWREAIAAFRKEFEA